MASITIVDSDLLRDEIEALYRYVNRDEYNLTVVEAMISELQNIVEGLKPTKEVLKNDR